MCVSKNRQSLFSEEMFPFILSIKSFILKFTDLNRFNELSEHAEIFFPS